MPAIPIRRAVGLLTEPAIVVSIILAACETLPAAYYGRYLAASEPAPAYASLALSFFGTFATYLLLTEIVLRHRWLRAPLVALVAIWAAALQVLYFGIYREFATLPTVSIVDFARQTPTYAWALVADRLTVVSAGAGILAVLAVGRSVLWGFQRAPQRSRNHLLGLAFVVLASYCYCRAPFMSFGQQSAWLVLQSSHGPGVVNASWTPDRDRPRTDRPSQPFNVVVFRLEEIAAQATTLSRPELATTPYLKSLVREHPEEALVASQHYANSTATDVSVMSIYSGLSPAADLAAHRRTPLLWDYFSAAGYDTSMFIPFHLEWGDFRTRFNARPGELHLNKLVDAGNSGIPLAYDNSINDVDVAELALEYQRQRSWKGPFLQIVSLKMPHAIGEGARVNKLSYGDWPGEPADLKDYYNGIRHDDELMSAFVAKMPPAVRENTIFVVLSDHGTRLFPRNDGVEVLHRLDNYHAETTRVPFLIYVPLAVQRSMPPERIEHLRANLASKATSNIDMVPTLLGLVGIRRMPTGLDYPKILAGRDLTTRLGPTDVVVQVNTGPLRRWDREHFALLLENGNYHYLFSMGRELLFDVPSDPNENSNLLSTSSDLPVLGRARAIVAQVPELLRIQRKYVNAPREEVAAVAKAEAPPNLLVTMLEPSASAPLPKMDVGGGTLVGRYAVTAPATLATMRTELNARIRSGVGHLEWRVTGEHLSYTGYVNGLVTSDEHRFAFLWKAQRPDESLTIELFGAADEGDDFSVEITSGFSSPDAAVPKLELETVALTFGPAIEEQVETLGHDRFYSHACLSNPSATCPNGYLVWGPYVSAVAGAKARLRYDVDARQEGVRLWLDLSAEGGKRPIARSRTFALDKPGQQTFEFATRLRLDEVALEGRLNAFVHGAGVSGLAIKDSHLSLAEPRKLN